MKISNQTQSTRDFAKEVICFLNEAAKNDASKSKSKMEQSTQRIATGFLSASLLTFSILCVLAYFHSRVSSLSRPIILTALWLSLATQVLAVISLLPQSVAGLVLLVRFKKWAANDREDEFDRDNKLAEDLTKFTRLALNRADFWLAQHASRLERRMNRFFAGQDKLAVFSILGATITVAKPFMSIFDDSSKISRWVTSINLDPTLSSMMLVVFALLFGIGIGGLLMRSVLSQIAYQRDLIGLALHNTEKL